MLFPGCCVTLFVLTKVETIIAKREMFFYSLAFDSFDNLSRSQVTSVNNQPINDVGPMVRPFSSRYSSRDGRKSALKNDQQFSSVE